MRRKAFALYGVILGILVLGVTPIAWSGHSGGAFLNSKIVTDQAILPGSFWTPVVAFQIDDDDVIANGDGPVNLISVTLTLSNAPAPPVGTPSIEPGDFAALAIAIDNRFHTGLDTSYDPLFDPIISITSFEQDSLTATAFFGENRGILAADADIPFGPNNYFVLIKTSPTISDSARFVPFIQVATDNSSGENPPDTVDLFDDTHMRVVNNVGDLRPNAEGVNGSGIPLVRADRATTGEQEAFPPLYPIGRSGHPDAFGHFSSASGGVPEIWPAGSALRPVLGLELGGGFDNTDIRLRSVTLELVSTGRRGDLLSDGIDNDGDNRYLIDDGVDDDFDGQIDNLGEGIDEDAVTGKFELAQVANYQLENRNDDNDYYVDNAGPDGVWGINKIDGINDDPGVIGVFDSGVDYVYNDDGQIQGELDAFDTLPSNASIRAISDERKVQKRLANEDLDAFMDDANNPGINFELVLFPVGFDEEYDFGIDPILIDNGRAPGVFDIDDEFRYPGLTARENFFHTDRISNDDGDYFMIDGLPIRRVKVEEGGRRILGPERFVPYWDEIYVDNPSGGVRFQLDASDTMLASGTNGYPLPASFPAFLPDNDVRNFNDDGDYYIDDDDGNDLAYDLGIDILVFDTNGNQYYDPGDEITVDRNANGRFDFGFDFVRHTGDNDTIETIQFSIFEIPSTVAVFNSTENFMVGFAIARDLFLPFEAWTPADKAAIAAIVGTTPTLNLWEAANIYLTQQYEAGDPRMLIDPPFIVFVVDTNENLIPDIDFENIDASLDEILYDNRFFGNPPIVEGGRPIPRAEMDDEFEDTDENGYYTFGDYVLYYGGDVDDQGNIFPATEPELPDVDDDRVYLRPVVDEEPADPNAPIGANGRDDDGDGEVEPFDVADGQDNDEDSVDTDLDGWVDGLEALYNTNPSDPLSVPLAPPVPYWVFIDEGIDEDTNYTPFGLGYNVDADNAHGALIDEDGMIVDDNGDPILDGDGYRVPAPNGFDDDGDGQIDEDLPNFVRDDIILTQLVDEEFEDGIDNDFDGLIDEDVSYVPLTPITDEEILDYFVDEPMSPSVPIGVTLVNGRFDFVKAYYDENLTDDKPGGPMELGMQAAFGPRFDPVYPSPSFVLIGFLEFVLSADGDTPYDEYYIDFNANGVYDVEVRGAYENRQSECLWPGFDGIPTLKQGDVYGEKATPVDNDGDGEDNDGDPLTPPVPDGIDNDEDGLIDEGFNEDCGDSAFTFEDYEGSGSSPDVHGVQVYLDSNNNGIFDATQDTRVSLGFAELVSPGDLPARGGLDYVADFPRTQLKISLNNDAVLDRLDDFFYDFFVVMQTDDDDNDSAATSSTLKGLSYGDDWSVKLGRYNLEVSKQNFSYGNVFPQDIAVENPMVGGMPVDFEQTKVDIGRLYMNDIIGYIGNDSFYGEVGGILIGVPYVDATNSYLPVFGLNLTSAANDNPTADTSGGQTSTERLVSVRVNFVGVDLEGTGTFEPTDLADLQDRFGSGVALFADSPTVGSQGQFDFDVVNDQPGDPMIPINNPIWDEDLSDPIVLAGGHYVVLRPDSGVELPTSDDETDTEFFDFFVAIRTSDKIDYHDAFRCFIRDGDIRLGNSRNEVNTYRDGDPIAANPPVFLSDLTKPNLTGQMPLAAGSPPTAVIGIDLHDTNETFDGAPSRMRSVHVYFDNLPDATGSPDENFTPRDLLEVYWGPDNAYRQWSIYEPATDQTRPYPGPGRIVSNNGVALYRDMPDSDTNGGFDDPMDAGVVNPDVPVLLSGVEDWNFLGGFTYNVHLMLDPPRYEGDEDVSAVDPKDPDPYEPMPDSITGEFEGDDYFVVIRTSESIKHGDDFRAAVRVETGNSLGGTPSMTFYPDLYNSARHLLPTTPPYSEEISFESLTTGPLVAPMVTITSYQDLVGPNARQDASSEPFAVFGINVEDSTFGTETLSGVRVELRSLDGFDESELNPLTNDALSGLALYQDNPTAGVQGEFDAADINVPIVRPVFDLNYFADHPGADGVYGTADDPGTPGTFDEGLDEVFIEPANGPNPGIVDMADILIDDGDNNRPDVPIGATLYLLQNQPGIEFQISVDLRSATPADLPNDDLLENAGPDFFVVARTSSEADFLDKYCFRIYRKGLMFSSGASFASADAVSQSVSTNVPTYLQDIAPSQFGSVEDRIAVIAVHCVNSRPEPVTLRNLTLRFRSIDDNDFTFTDLAPLQKTLAQDKSLESGISVWRNTNGNSFFDYHPENPSQGDQLVPLASIPTYVGDVADPYSRFSVKLSLSAGSPYVKVPDVEPLEGGAPDYFVVLKPSDTASRDDDFEIDILPGDVIYGVGAKDSFETLTTKTITFNIDSPPFFTFLAPAQGASAEVRGTTTYTIRWSDEDVDSNADINLYYFRDEDEYPTDPNSEKLIKINEFALPEDADGVDGDTYAWDVSEVSAEVPLRLMATVDDEVNPILVVYSGGLTVFNELPTFDFVRPVTAEEGIEDYFTVEWTDSDFDNNANIDLYLVPDSVGSATEILVASGIEEDPEGSGDTYDIPIARLLSQGHIQAQQDYNVRAKVTDGVVRGVSASEAPVVIVTSTGTIRPILLPRILVTQPEGFEVVNVEKELAWDQDIPVGDAATIELFWATEGDVGNATPGLQINGGVVLPDIQQITESPLVTAENITSGTFLWNLLTPDQSAFKDNLPFDVPIRIYAQITDDFGNVRGTFSEGQLRIDEHFIIVLEPAARIPSATVTEDNPLTIQWEGYSRDSNATISLFRDDDAKGLNGKVLLDLSGSGLASEARNIPLSAGEFIWNVTGVPLGSYYIYAQLDDEYHDATFHDYSDGAVRVGRVVGLLLNVACTGQMRLSGKGVPADEPALAPESQIRNVEFVSTNEGVYFLDGAGQVYRQDGSTVLPSMHFGWDVARDLEVIGEGQGFYILDALGGIQNLDGADSHGVPYFGWNIARDMEVTPSEKGYYVLDGYGGIHAFGDAESFYGPFFNWDIARDLEVLPQGDGLYILDGYGGVHTEGAAENVGSVFFGWDIARDLLVTRSGKGYYVLDGYGAVYGLGDANLQSDPIYTSDVAQDLATGRANLFLDVLTVREWALSTTDSVPDADPATSVVSEDEENNWVLWVDDTPDTNTGRDIYYLNTSTGQTGTVVAEVQTQDNPAIDGDLAVWNSKESGDWDIYMRQMPDGEITQITTGSQNQTRPDVSKGVVVWQDYDTVNANWDVYLYDTTGGMDTVAINVSPGTEGSDQQYPKVFTTATDATGYRDVYVAWVDNRNGNTNLDIFLFHGELDVWGNMTASEWIQFATATGSRDQFSPDVNFNRYACEPELVLAYSDNSAGDLNVFFESIDPDTLKVTQRRTIPSAGATNPSIPVDVNPQFLPVIGEDRIAFIDRRSGFWDVYISDFRVFSLRREEPDGEIRITDTRQQVTELATAGTKVVWMEAEGGVARLQVGTIEIQELPSRKVFSSSKSAREASRQAYAPK